MLEYHAPAGLDVKDVVNNSEKAVKNTVFAALKGERQDGMDHIKDALTRGCAAVICDRNKRHLMGGVSSRLADLTVITCDNSRSEDPESIIGDILRGVDKTSSYKVICDRREAILYALGLSSGHDVILLAGKGHEDYEINRNGSRYFSEASIIREFNDGGQYYGDNDSGGSGGALRRQTQGRSGG